ncbi:MAG TPA: DUF3050 domain-containing protein [Pyrinomonadaceae bacterium]|nr:DUF3050 domain-containing protein [Pyrinomonadaceae bacterium]
MLDKKFPHEYLEVVRPYRSTLHDHPIYNKVANLDQVRLFMEAHVFAVWDFMCLLKALQRAVTCIDTPWLPRGDPATRRLINEIVTGEESDLLPSGQCASHFELYLEAMTEAGANTDPIRCFLKELQAGQSVGTALENSNAPRGAREFVLTTMDIVATSSPHIIAAAFAIGREDIIPTMFIEIVRGLPASGASSLNLFHYYLERHIQLDGDEHSELAERMLVNLCGDDTEKWRESAEAAVTALQARVRLWDSVEEQMPWSIPTPGELPREQVAG